MIVNCKTSAELWERLVSIHEQVSTESIFMLIQQFVDYKFAKGDSIATHVAKIEMMAQNLEDIGQPMSENQIISKLITSLPSEYKHVLIAWKSMPAEQKTRKTLIRKVFEEEAMNKIIKTRKNDENDSALLVRNNRRDEQVRADSDNKFNNEHIKEFKKKSRCHNCGEIGHWWQDGVCTKKIDKKFGQRGPDTSRSTARVIETTNIAALVTQSVLHTSLS